MTQAVEMTHNNSHSAKRALIAVGVAAFLLAGCASRFKADVARFYTPTLPKAESFQVVPSDPAKVGSLEFAQYADLVRNKLIAQGYRPAAQGEVPTLDVRLDYVLSSGREQIRSTHSPSFGFYGLAPYGFYGYYPRSRFGFGGHGSFGGYGAYGGSEVSSRTIYTRGLTLEITKAGKPEEKLFEGRAISDGADGRLTEVVPYLVQAMFEEFPGQSGVTKRVVIKTPNKSGNSY